MFHGNLCSQRKLISFFRLFERKKNLLNFSIVTLFTRFNGIVNIRGAVCNMRAKAISINKKTRKRRTHRAKIDFGAKIKKKNAQQNRQMYGRTDGRMNVCVLIFNETLKYQSWTMNEIYSQCELFLLFFILFRERAHSQDIDRCTLCVVRLVHSKRSRIFIEMVFTLKEISFALRIGLFHLISQRAKMKWNETKNYTENVNELHKLSEISVRAHFSSQVNLCGVRNHWIRQESESKTHDKMK